MNTSDSNYFAWMETEMGIALKEQHSTGTSAIYRNWVDPLLVSQPLANKHYKASSDQLAQMASGFIQSKYTFHTIVVQIVFISVEKLDWNCFQTIISRINCKDNSKKNVNDLSAQQRKYIVAKLLATLGLHDA